MARARHVTADALVLHRPRHLERQEFEVPEVGDDDGVLRVEACGLCGTDHEQYTCYENKDNRFYLQFPET